MTENIGDILKDTADRMGKQFEYIAREAQETFNSVIKENADNIKEWQKNNALPDDLVAAYNKGIEDAAKVIIELGTNNVGMIHDLNAREAEAIRRLKK